MKKGMKIGETIQIKTEIKCDKDGWHLDGLPVLQLDELLIKEDSNPGEQYTIEIKRTK